MQYRACTAGRHRNSRIRPPRRRLSWVTQAGWVAAAAATGLVVAGIVIPPQRPVLETARSGLACAPRAVLAAARSAGAGPGAGQRAPAPPCPGPRVRADRVPAQSRAGAVPAARTAAAPAPARSPVPAQAQAAAANTACDIIVPANPLSAQGLATPYQLTGPGGTSPQESGCTMANSANLGAFVQATILDPATGALSVYEPLVITQGTTPAIAPAMPRLPAGAVVTIDFGFNGTDLTQVGATPGALQQGNCVNGLGQSIFGQVSFCNGDAFFAAAFRAESAGVLSVPQAGISPVTGQPCPTTRSFDVVDQDPSDNVTTTYLLTRGGQTAQYSPANATGLPGAAKLNNGSDNELLDAFLDPALRCVPFEAPDQSQGGKPGTSQALDELAAAADQLAPVALVPENDEMVMTGDAFSVAKTNLYRASIGQDPVSAANDATSSPANFCRNMTTIQPVFLASYQRVLSAGPTPVPAIGDNLLTFMANRLSMSFANLSCQRYGLVNPVSVTLGPGGAAVAARFRLGGQPHPGCDRGGYQPPAARQDGTHPAGWDRQPATGR